MMRPSNWLLEFYLDWSPIIWCIFLAASIAGACAGIVRADNPRKARCSSACHPYRVVSCESGATWCADGTVHWRKDGEP